MFQLQLYHKQFLAFCEISIILLRAKRCSRVWNFNQTTSKFVHNGKLFTASRMFRADGQADNLVTATLHQQKQYDELTHRALPTGSALSYKFKFSRVFTTTTLKCRIRLTRAAKIFVLLTVSGVLCIPETTICKQNKCRAFVITSETYLSADWSLL